MSTCDVSLGDWDGDSPDFYSEEFVRSRKEHHCYECSRTIPRGVTYERVSGKWDGEVRTFKFCEACSEIQREFSEGGRTFGVVWEEFREQWHSGANLQACLNRVSSVAAKAKLREMWLAYKGLA